jgi:predicted nucleic acid-binding protein
VNILLDTNIVLDALLTREPYHGLAEDIFALAGTEKITGYVTANSVTDIYYIVKKRLGDSVARKALRDMINVFAVIPVDGRDCRRALDSEIADFEDGVVMVCATKCELDCIVTRDAEFLRYKKYPIPVLTPEQFLEWVL